MVSKEVVGCWMSDVREEKAAGQANVAIVRGKAVFALSRSLQAGCLRSQDCVCALRESRHKITPEGERLRLQGCARGRSEIFLKML